MCSGLFQAVSRVEEGVYDSIGRTKVSLQVNDARMLALTRGLPRSRCAASGDRGAAIACNL